MTTHPVHHPTTPPRACARGCTWVDDAGERRPSEATYGQLCAWDAARLHDALTWAPGVVALLRAQTSRGPRPAHSTERVSGSRAPGTPLDIDAVELADTIHEVIATHCDDAVRIMGVPGPASSHRRLTGDINPRPLRATSTPASAHDEIQAHTSWMLQHLESVAWLSHAPDIHDEIVTAVRRGRTAAGATPPSRRLVRRPCPVCLTRTIEVRWLDDDTAQVRCRHCHFAMPTVNPAELISRAA